MTFTVFNSSPESDAPQENRHSVGKIKYPFSQLDIGKSFAVPIDGTNLKSLRALVKRNTKGDKRFVLVVHTERGVIEVARKAAVIAEPAAVADTTATATWGSKTYAESLASVSAAQEKPAKKSKANVNPETGLEMTPENPRGYTEAMRKQWGDREIPSDAELEQNRALARAGVSRYLATLTAEQQAAYLAVYDDCGIPLTKTVPGGWGTTHD